VSGQLQVMGIFRKDKNVHILKILYEYLLKGMSDTGKEVGLEMKAEKTKCTVIFAGQNHNMKTTNEIRASEM